MAVRRRSVSRKSRRASRKASRRSSRRAGRRSSRRSYRRQSGGQMAESLAQGKEYAQIHAAQHGGAAVSLAASAPVGYTGVLDDSLRGAARVLPLDQSIDAVQGLSDQTGGGKRRKARRGITMRNVMGRAGYIVRHPFAATMGYGKKMTKGMKKLYKKAYKKAMQTRRRMMRGGAGVSPADYGAPGMLLSPAMEAKALAGMNPEWKLATDPSSFAPRTA